MRDPLLAFLALLALLGISLICPFWSSNIAFQQPASYESFRGRSTITSIPPHRLIKEEV